MSGFTSRTTVDAALAWLDAHLAPLEPEEVPLAAAFRRVLAEPLASGVDVPGFDRAMMDGFAVVAQDTLGATAYNPLELAIVGESLPGRPLDGRISKGSAARIMTGAPLPEGADAVVPAEVAEATERALRLLAEVSPGKHVGRRGEDVAAGSQVLASGRRLRPQDIGLISSIGIAQVTVVRRPRVMIVTTGDELLPAGSAPRGYRIADSNSVMLAALVERDGGVPLCRGIVPDRPEAILTALRELPCRDAADLVVVSGGSSVGQEDYAPSLVAAHGDLAVHGLAMRPSSPTGMGRLDGRLVFLLPGNPVSCLCAYDFFAGRAVRVLGGLSAAWPYRRVEAPLQRKLVSIIGRVDYARVRLVDGRVEPLATSGASILSSTVRADGFVLVPADSEGYGPGTIASVYLYDDGLGGAP
jgi:molybdopterin molybdotransferase